MDSASSASDADKKENHMKKSVSVLILALCFSLNSTKADSLRFTSGSVGTNFSTVVLSIAGPTNLVCQVERLNPSNDAWEIEGYVNLGPFGNANFTNSLVDGIYGFFRTKATNNSALATNAFGAVCGYLGAGDSFIGNIFAAANISTIIPNPPEGIEALKYINGSGWSIASYEDGAWANDVTIGTFEGVYIQNGATETRYIVSGLFDTNTIVKSIPSGLSAVCLPLYHVNPVNTWDVDTFNSSQPGGVSGLPVQSSGYVPQCRLYQLINNANLYSTNLLTSSNVWQHAGTNINLQFGITEGFFIDKPTNATWSVSRPIW
jgi:hypothetical protein